MIKFFFSIAFLSALFFLETFHSAEAVEKKENVIVYNWPDYIPQDVLTDFTKETGIEVVYSSFESNEVMFTKLKLLGGKGYDIVVPSSYFIEPMVQEGLLQRLDLSKIPNMKNFDPQWLDQSFDKGNKYSVPYMLGCVGIAYNTKYIPKGSITKWTDLLNPKFKGKILLSDDLRDIFGLALKATGHTVNEQNKEAVKEAYEFLRKVKDAARIFDVTATRRSFVTEEVWIGSIWNADYLVTKEENSHIEFVFPEEGAVFAMDNFAIPSGAENVDNAHAFINYMARPDIVKRCTEDHKYSTPNLAAEKLFSQEDQNNPVLILDIKRLKNVEFLTAIGSIIELYEKYWGMLKTEK